MQIAKFGFGPGGKLIVISAIDITLKCQIESDIIKYNRIKLLVMVSLIVQLNGTLGDLGQVVKVES